MMRRLVFLVLVAVAAVSVIADEDDLGCNLPMTCSDLMAAGVEDTGDGIEIDPDGSGPIPSFRVKCRGPLTYVHHDNENETPVDPPQGKKKAGPGSVRIAINYPDVTPEQIAKLIEVAGDCTQKISYDCDAAPIFAEGIQFAWWEDVRGSKKTNWGGAPEIYVGCKCSIGDKTCENSESLCNCDGVQSGKDAGKLSEALPVTALNFGGFGIGSSGRYKLGPLICGGTPKVIKEEPAPKVKANPEAKSDGDPADDEFDCKTDMPLKGVNRFHIEVTAKGSTSLRIKPTDDGEAIDIVFDATDDNGNFQTTVSRGGVLLGSQANAPDPSQLLLQGQKESFWVSFMFNMFQMGRRDEKSNGAPFLTAPLDQPMVPDIVCLPKDDTVWDFPTHSAYELDVCEDAPKEINCGDEYIQIHYANYGRIQATSSCSGDDVGPDNCRMDTTFAKVLGLCQNNKKCDVSIADLKLDRFDDDSECADAVNYVTVRYRCTARPTAVTPDVGPCSNNPCFRGSKCVAVDDNTPSCVCPEGATGEKCDEETYTCWARGDPHYVDFDGNTYDYQGSCTYVLAKPSPAEGEEISKWLITVFNLAPKPGSKVTRSSVITVIVGDTTITLGQKGKSKKIDVKLNGVATHYPLQDPNGRYNIGGGDRLLFVESDMYHFRITWDGQSKVSVEVPASLYKGHMLGLCGPANGNGPTGIYYSKDGTAIDAGKAKKPPLEKINPFGDSWVYGEGCKTTSTKSVECVANSPRAIKAAEMCQQITPDHEGLLGNSIRTLRNSKKLKKFFDGALDDCLFDQCIMFNSDKDPQPDEDTEENRCETFTEVARKIKGSNGAGDIDSWFDEANCPQVKFCGNGLHLGTPSDCDNVCGQPKSKKKKKGCKYFDVDECICNKKSHWRFEDQCVKKKDCGCMMNGSPYMVGESVLNDGCTQVCTCKRGKQDMDCEDVDCHSCDIEEGERQCGCDDGFSVDDFTCLEDGAKKGKKNKSKGNKKNKSNNSGKAKDKKKKNKSGDDDGQGSGSGKEKNKNNKNVKAKDKKKKNKSGDDDGQGSGSGKKKNKSNNSVKAKDKKKKKKNKSGDDDGQGSGSGKEKNKSNNSVKAKDKKKKNKSGGGSDNKRK